MPSARYSGYPEHKFLHDTKANQQKASTYFDHGSSEAKEGKPRGNP
jgi:hypothetical protein